jgi:DNA-binding response OmpR family regulator
MGTETIKRILLVEDDLSLGSMLLSALHSHAYEVAAVTGAEAGLISLKVDSIDLIILDILLPHMNGLDFLVEKNRLGYVQPVIVVSNMGDIKIQQKALSLGAAHYLIKANTTPSIIIKLVEELLQPPEPTST